MRLIIEARLEGAQTGATATEATIVDVVERQDRSVADLGLTLAEGRALLAKVQSILVSQFDYGDDLDLEAEWKSLRFFDFGGIFEPIVIWLLDGTGHRPLRRQPASTVDGAVQRHCVGLYVRRCVENHSAIFQMRCNGEREVTIEGGYCEQECSAG